MPLQEQAALLDNLFVTSCFQAVFCVVKFDTSDKTKRRPRKPPPDGDWPSWPSMILLWDYPLQGLFFLPGRLLLLCYIIQTSLLAN